MHPLVCQANGSRPTTTAAATVNTYICHSCQQHPKSQDVLQHTRLHVADIHECGIVLVHTDLCDQICHPV